MSLRFSLYAVDLPRFEALLPLPLADLLRRYAERGRQAEPGLMISDMTTPDGFRLYSARPGRLLAQDLGRDATPGFSTLDPATVPYLSRPFRTHLEGSDNAALWNLLDAFSEADGEGWVVRLLSGFKTGPPAALAQIAEAVFGREHPDRRRLIDLFRKVFRRFVPEPPFDGKPFERADFAFPVTPREDGVGWMSVWTPAEARFLVGALERLGSPDRYRTLVSPEPERVAYYREMVEGLLRLRRLPFAEPTVVGFIDP